MTEQEHSRLAIQPWFQDRLESESTAATFLGLSARTLQMWRFQNKGPVYLKLGRAVRYRPGDLIDFFSSSSLGSMISAEVETERVIFTEAEAAEYLNLAPITLRKGRMDGVRQNRCPIPPYVRLGRAIRYLKSDLDAWLNEYRVVPTEKMNLGEVMDEGAEKDSEHKGSGRVPGDCKPQDS